MAGVSFSSASRSAAMAARKFVDKFKRCSTTVCTHQHNLVASVLTLATVLKLAAEIQVVYDV